MAVVDDSHGVVDVLVDDHHILDLCRGEGIVDIIDRIRVIPQNIDPLALDLTHDSLNTVSLQADTRPDRVDVVMPAGNGDLGAVPGLTDDLDDVDLVLGDLRTRLEEAADEFGA